MNLGICVRLRFSSANVLHLRARLLVGQTSWLRAPLCEFELRFLAYTVASDATEERTLNFLIFLDLSFLATGMDLWVLFGRWWLFSVLLRFLLLGWWWRCSSLVTSITVGGTLTGCSLSLESLFNRLVTTYSQVICIARDDITFGSLESRRSSSSSTLRRRDEVGRSSP